MKVAAGILILAIAVIAVVASGGWTETLWGWVGSLTAVAIILILAVGGLVRYMWTPGEGIQVARSGSTTDWHKIAPGHEDKSSDP